MVHLLRCRILLIGFLSIPVAFGSPREYDNYGGISPLRKNFLRYFLKGTLNFNSIKPRDTSSKHILSRPVRRLGSEFLGKRSSSFPFNKENEDNSTRFQVIENGNHYFEGIPLQDISKKNSLNNKRKLDIYNNRNIKSLFSILLKKSRDDYFKRRFGKSLDNNRNFISGSFTNDYVGSEFLGKRSGLTYNASSAMNPNVDLVGKEITNEGVWLAKDIPEADKPSGIKLGPKDLKMVKINRSIPNKKTIGVEFLGKRALNKGKMEENDVYLKNKIIIPSDFDKRALGSEFLRKRALGAEFLGKRDLGAEFLGKGALGAEFLGKKALDAEFLGKRASGAEFLGKRALGGEFLGKRTLGAEFLGKRALGAEFLGKRALGGEFLGKRTLGAEFLGKKSFRC